jgi:hypothetical protein
MAYTFQGTSRVLQAIAEVSTTQMHPLGTIVTAFDETYGSGEFIYLKGVASTVVGSAVTYNLVDGTTTLLVADAIGPVAFAMSVTDAATDFGWYQISGVAVAKSDTVADNANVYIDNTAGQVDDAVVDGDMVHLAKFASASGTPSAGFALVEISRPYTDNITTND